MGEFDLAIGVVVSNARHRNPTIVVSAACEFICQFQPGTRVLKGEAWKDDKYRAPNGEDTGSGGKLRLRKCGANTKRCRADWATRAVIKIDAQLHRNAST